MKASGAISSFLSHHHAGVYTTMRTVCKGQKIFAFNEHVRRLALVREAIDPSTKYGGFDEEATRRLVGPRVRDAILSKKKVMSDRHHDDNAGELKVSVALRMREGPSVAQASLEDMEICVAVDELTEPGQGAEVCVQAAVAHRDNPTVKHGDWIEQRKELEANMPKHCNEVIMIDKEGRVSEGLSSNVVAVDEENGCIVTAPSDLVLSGTILQLLLAICEEESIPVKRESPKLSDLKRFGVLITSTSRLALPVKQIIMPDGTLEVIETKKRLIQHLVTKVRERIEAESVQIL